jgi:type II secretory pathway pseudopilin PulG
MSIKRQSGFTVLELIVAVVFLVAVGTIFFVQSRDLKIEKNDAVRKNAINSIYYDLEDVYYPAVKAYPERLAADQLKGIDPASLNDPNGVAIGDSKSQYHYEAKDCKDGQCKSYKLWADMEHEATFTKTSRNQ